MCGVTALARRIAYITPSGMPPQVRITTASAIVFMGTSLTLAYLGYQSSDVRLFDETTPFDVETPSGALGAPEEEAGLQEIEIPEETGGLEEIPMPEAAQAEAPTEAPAE